MTDYGEMSLEQKAGQLFTFYYKNTAYTEDAEKLIVELGAGGMFLDMQCLNVPEQVHRLTSAMQDAALSRGSGIPLFVAADFVAGAGCKLASGGAVHFPKNRAIGEAGDERLAYESGRITAEESLIMGVNFNYSPVVDVNNNPDNPVIGTHSFGDTADVVSRMGTAVIRGYQEHGMIATAKHFPGHGDTNVDSHLALPVLPFDRERLETFELAPFRRAIEAGVDAIMVGHIAVPALDPSMLPATLSRPMVTGLLREQMGYEGLIVTDGMSMQGVASLYTQSCACVMALQAGADILLVDPRDTAEAREMVAAVLRAVRNGELTEARLDESLRRIRRAKERYGLTPQAFQPRPFDGRGLKRDAAVAVSRELAARALLRHGEPGAWERVRRFTRKGGRWMVLYERSLSDFADGLAAGGVVVERLKFAAYEDMPQALEQADEGFGWIVAITHNKRMRFDVLNALEQRAALRELPVLLAHFGSPYDAAAFPGLPALLLHDRAPALQEAAASELARQWRRGRRRA
ncbi:MAG TPA: glycoside hydrolase family 3 N-terminal domain-containing protein [Paenibacillus sp.]|uniref:glycoside hydrolase family 3 protein n=1 Tax=Paenibacillus sp. TaxID=58172 RepID=UPI002B7192B5|nr:glycoside hydrolase family 3 N-terminal domain-containing protein [Paenibacillus sp.]HUC94069.1 glycoside hydrolase family 3 N-terminal domain-containing protein [Paenibacillus sp.]